MLMKSQKTGSTNPVAILDKEIRKASSFRIEIFELCSLCGARFGIGHFGVSKDNAGFAGEMDAALPRKLIRNTGQGPLASSRAQGADRARLLEVSS
jgi:hypothetical protein